MKKLAIFGDSYAECDLDKVNNNIIGWTYMMQQTWDCDIYAIGGASFSWSFNSFLQNNLNYDRVIFCVTNPYRYTFPLEYTNKNTNIREIKMHWPGLVSIERFETYAKDYDKNIFLTLKNWFLHTSITEPFHSYNCDQIISGILAIRSIRPDAIIVPNFGYLKKHQSYGIDALLAPYDWCLFDISQNEIQLDKLPYLDPRSNHLSKSSNIWLFDHMQKRLLENIYVPWSPDQTPQFSSVDELMVNL